MPAKKTHEQFVNEMQQLHPYIDILEDYVDTHTKVRFKCMKCGHEWITTPHQIIAGVGCPACRPRRRRTHEMFVEEMKEVNPSIEIISRFQSFQVKVDCRCLIDGYEWSALPQALLRGHGCRKCSDRNCSENSKYSHEEFVEKIHQLSPNIIILSQYNGSAEKVACRCTIDGHEWSTNGSNLLHGKGCPICGNKQKGVTKRKTTKEFKQQLELVNPAIEIIGEYIGTHSSIKCRCKIDGTVWDGIPANLLKGAQCPQCRGSIGEKIIAELLDKYNIPYYSQYRFSDCKDIRTLPFDFYLSEYNTCIEFDGAQHYRPVNFGGCSDEVAFEAFIQTQKHDAIKNAYCESNNITLIRIAYNSNEDLNDLIQKIKNS